MVFTFQKKEPNEILTLRVEAGLLLAMVTLRPPFGENFATFTDLLQFLPPFLEIRSGSATLEIKGDLGDSKRLGFALSPPL